MKTIARTMMSMGMTAGLFAVAQAQTAPAKPAAAAPTAAKAAAPAAPAAAKATAPTAAKQAPTAPVSPPPPMEMPKAPAEVAEMAKAAGNWRCAGLGFSPVGEMKMVATLKNKVDLDKWWVRTTFAETGGGKFKFEAFTTYDATAKQWKRVMVDNFGSHEIDTSAGLKDGKLQWEGTSVSSMGSMPGRHYEDVTNPKEMKMWGEFSMDKGKTYMKAYEVTCKR